MGTWVPPCLSICLKDSKRFKGFNFFASKCLQQVCCAQKFAVAREHMQPNQNVDDAASDTPHIPSKPSRRQRAFNHWSLARCRPFRKIIRRQKVDATTATQQLPTDPVPTSARVVVSFEIYYVQRENIHVGEKIFPKLPLFICLFTS